jgi:subfamily B ATP-binding cassette protein MsbA
MNAPTPHPPAVDSEPGGRRKPSDKYLRRFLAYALAYKGLLAAAIAAGLFKFGLNYSFPWLIGEATDLFAADGRFTGMSRDDRLWWLWALAGLGIVLSVLHGISAWARGVLTAILGVRIIRDIRQRLFDHLHRLSLQFYSRERTGSLASRLIGDISIASQLVNGGIVTVAMDSFSLVLGTILLVWLDWRLAIAALATLPLYAMTFKVLNPKVRRASRLVASSISRISGNVQERLGGIALVKTYAAEDREQAAFNLDTERHYDRNVTQTKISNTVGAISEFLVHLNQVIFIALGGWLVLRPGETLTPGDVVTGIGYLAVMYLPVRRFAEVNVIFQTSMASIERVFQVFDITPAVVDKPDARREPPRHGRVTFDNVWFDYHTETDEGRGLPESHKIGDLRNDAEFDARRSRRREAVEVGRAKQRRRGVDKIRHRTSAKLRQRSNDPQWVLRGLQFEVEPGERVALVGPSGAGKTTLVSLLPRLYDIDRGAIKLDGVDIRDYTLRALRQGIGIVQQDSFLFSGTIRENIAYGRPDATDKEIEAAADAANAATFINDLEDGYDSVIGERGVSLSGGQRQRISIARAVLKDPRILILDEATSALDTESEALVQQALERLMQDRTSLIIAHRLSTVRNADRILVLDRGQVVESGPHDDLVEQGGLYARLVRQQFGTTEP